MLALFAPLNSGLATATAPSATATAGVVVPTGRVNSWYDSGKRLLSDEADGMMSVPAACNFMADPALNAVSVSDKKAFLASKGVDEFVIAQAECVAPKDWPMRGGSSGYHRMAGRIGDKPTPPAAAEALALKEQCYAAVARREQVQAALPDAIARLERLSIPSDPMFLDEAAAISAQAFPLGEEELIAMAKEYLYFGQGTAKPELLAPSFVFMGPYVGGAGGLPRDEYLKAVGGFNLKEAFPDLNPRFHHFRLDPLDAGRVWFTSQASGTDKGSGFLGNQPTGKSFSTPPQACSLKFNEEGKVVKYTIGHVMERSIGNTGGLGGIFGPAYAIGKPLPFPEARPWKPSKRYRALQLVGRLVSFLGEKKKQ